MKIEQIETEKLVPYARNPRKNDLAVDSVAASIKEFGFKQPIVIDADNVIVVGHTRVKAAQKLGLTTVPCLRADDLTPQQIKAYRILDNKVAEKAEWDDELLQLELGEIELDLGPFEVEFDSVNDLIDKEEAQLAGSGAKLADRFLIPPFSVLDARQGWWQDRKRAWLSLGIKSELGRGGHLEGVPDRQPD